VRFIRPDKAEKEKTLKFLVIAALFIIGGFAISFLERLNLSAPTITALGVSAVVLCILAPLLLFLAIFLWVSLRLYWWFILLFSTILAIVSGNIFVASMPLLFLTLIGIVFVGYFSFRKTNDS